MGNFTNTYQDVRNLTCRPRDNLTFRKELERQCHTANAPNTHSSCYNRLFTGSNC